jgi:hypothetical protein
MSRLGGGGGGGGSSATVKPNFRMSVEITTLYLVSADPLPPAEPHGNLGIAPTATCSVVRSTSILLRLLAERAGADHDPSRAHL